MQHSIYSNSVNVLYAKLLFMIFKPFLIYPKLELLIVFPRHPPELL